MFIDERRIRVRSGNGGHGIVAWRRERRVPRGGPAGGDGGRGGDVVLVADVQMTTFADMQDVRVVKAGNGESGSGNKCHGAGADDTILRVPVGTTVYVEPSGNKLVDFVEDGQTYVVARGGRGGRGNARFATATDQAPTHHTKGRPGRERTLRLELRLLADVGLVGLPNAGKSTLLSRVSAATPRVADYPFTTLVPHLGIVEIDRTRFVMADLPGLIEGAHAGSGLGDRFLRHIERTRVLLHLVDPLPGDGSNPIENYLAIRGELLAYDPALAERPEILVATKMDLYPEIVAGGGKGDDPITETLRELAARADRRVFPISAASGIGVRGMLREVAKVLAATRE